MHSGSCWNTANEMKSGIQRFRGAGLWFVALICLVPCVGIVLFFASWMVPEVIDWRLGVTALGLGWLFWAFAVAYTTPENGFDMQVFLLVLLLFPVMYPFCVVFLLGVMGMRHRLKAFETPEGTRDRKEKTP